MSNKTNEIFFDLSNSKPSSAVNLYLEEKPLSFNNPDTCLHISISSSIIKISLFSFIITT